MSPLPVRRPVAVALALSGAIGLAQLARVPAIADPTGAPLPAGLHLAAPPLYVALAPLFTLWDAISMLSMRRMVAFVLGTAVLYVVWRVLAIAWRRRASSGPRSHSWWRELGLLALSTALFLAFVAAGALWHRPMLALRGLDRETVAVDFHSHTAASRDVRNTLMRGFDLAANRRWHARAGFGAFFVTDHNTLRGWQTATSDSAPRPVACPGVEISAWRAHIVVLGDSLPSKADAYNDSLGAVLALLRTGDSLGWTTIASLPEYERSHRENLDAFVAAGVDGLEIVNGSPKANDVTRPRRDSLLAFARTNRLFVAAVTDAHGWGATVLGWSLVRAPGWTDRDADPCRAILRALREGGFGAVQMVERRHVPADTRWPRVLTPVAVLIDTWRWMSPAMAAGWLAWIWAVAIVVTRDRRGRTR